MARKYPWRTHSIWKRKTWKDKLYNWSTSIFKELTYQSTSSRFLFLIPWTCLLGHISPYPRLHMGSFPSVFIACSVCVISVDAIFHFQGGRTRWFACSVCVKLVVAIFHLQGDRTWRFGCSVCVSLVVAIFRFLEFIDFLALSVCYQ